MGLVYVFTGKGGGKTTNALGMALRSLGHGHKVVVIQFLKWYQETGEFKFKHENYEIYQCGKPGWKSRSELGDEDKVLQRSGIHIFNSFMLRGDTDLIVLDELNLAMSMGMIDVDIVLRILDNIPERTTIVITGREAPKEIIKIADLVNEISPVKSPEVEPCDKGIQY